MRPVQPITEESTSDVLRPRCVKRIGEMRNDVTLPALIRAWRGGGCHNTAKWSVKSEHENTVNTETDRARKR